MKWFGQRHQTTMIHRQWKERSAWTGFSMGRSSCVFVKPPVLVSQLVFGCFWRGWKISFSTVLYFIGIFQFDKHMQHMFQTSSNHLFQFCAFFFWGGGRSILFVLHWLTRWCPPLVYCKRGRFETSLFCTLWSLEERKMELHLNQYPLGRSPWI